MYVPGDSAIHRAPAGGKLALLAAAALLLSLLPWGVVGMAVAVLIASAGYVLAGLPARVLGRAWLRVLPLVVILGAALFFFADPATAFIAVGRIVALILLADLLTCTTRFGALMEALQRALGPLRRVGVDPEVVALTLSLAIATIPVMAGLIGQVRDAQRARGLRTGPRAGVALLVLVLRHADDVGEALAARGIAG
ncbi:energy-coupling factor transporter transmembrane protein EcfT [Microbacterium pseudoresistens]